jgi:hypothetical protein
MDVFIVANWMEDTRVPGVSAHHKGWDAFTQFARCVYHGTPCRVGAKIGGKALNDVCFDPEAGKVLQGDKRIAGAVPYTLEHPAYDRFPAWSEEKFRLVF